MSSDRGDTTRRRLLKSIGATGLAFGATGVSSAREVPTRELERASAAYDSPTRARWAAARHADSVLAELADRGVLDRGDATELDFEDASADPFYADGETVAHVTTETALDGATVELAVRPQTGRAYATVRTGDEVYTVESPAGSDDVSVQNCYYEHDCTSYACDGSGCVYLERQCCNYGDGYRCDDWSQDGCCSC
ncbi:hypothetical protein [Halorussus caseinilyticus]|uniref:Twin-arginine translocation signal domain-containing protein n=1 Tax=Halorussus caseinilyticus TaxID=3034025 RepID=A0ABD5WQQ7_9EURY|nr:hypothetical protein [Halorussus sp. DT72]